MPASHPVELRERIVRAHTELGLKRTEIAKLFAVGLRSVHRYINKERRGESLEPGTAPGVTAKLGAFERAWLRCELQKDPYWTSYELCARYNRRFSHNRVSRSTVYRAIVDLGFTHKKRRPSRRSKTGPT